MVSGQDQRETLSIQNPILNPISISISISISSVSFDSLGRVGRGPFRRCQLTSDGRRISRSKLNGRSSALTESDSRYIVSVGAQTNLAVANPLQRTRPDIRRPIERRTGCFQAQPPHFQWWRANSSWWICFGETTGKKRSGPTRVLQVFATEALP